jgi:hypothetical protein
MKKELKNNKKYPEMPGFNEEIANPHIEHKPNHNEQDNSEPLSQCHNNICQTNESFMGGVGNTIKNAAKSFGKTQGYGLLVAGAAVVPIALGFGTLGITAGSIAAGLQASVGELSAGSLISTMTSWAMRGYFANAVYGGIAWFGGAKVAEQFTRDNNQNGQQKRN